MPLFRGVVVTRTCADHLDSHARRQAGDDDGDSIGDPNFPALLRSNPGFLPSIAQSVGEGRPWC